MATFMDTVLNLCMPLEQLLDNIFYDDHSKGFIATPTKGRIKGNYSNKTQRVNIAWPPVETKRAVYQSPTHYVLDIERGRSRRVRRSSPGYC